MVTLALLAILVRLAAPSLSDFIKSSTMTSNVNSFLSDLRFARSEAIRRGGSVVMCRSNSPEASVPVCNGTTGATNGWVTGWVIFFDTDNDGAFDAGETILRVQGPISALDSVTETNASPAYRFRFSATGRLPLSSATSLQFGGGNFSNTAQRMVCVSVGGRGRVAGDGYASCS